jgi:hypothetical protein
MDEAYQPCERKWGEQFRKEIRLYFASVLDLISCAPISKNQPGKGSGFPQQDLPEVRIHDHAGSGQASGF